MSKRRKTGTPRNKPPIGTPATVAAMSRRRGEAPPRPGEDGVEEVHRLPTKNSRVRVGRPERVVTSTRSKVASFPLAGQTTGASFGNFYSPEYSTDYVELPQQLTDKWRWYRFFYSTDPFVAQAIDVHTEIPLSKIRLSMPKCQDKEMGKRALRFCQKWDRRIGLLQRLIEGVHEFNLIGEVFYFAEDATPDMPRDIREEQTWALQDGEAHERWKLRPDADEREKNWLKKHYKGWTALRIIPPELVSIETFPFLDEKIIELIPDPRWKELVARADALDEQAARVLKALPQEVVEALREGQNIPLNTDPDAGSHVVQVARKKSPYETHGHSLLERCMRVLVFRDKLRQAQTQIASRHMTPVRIVSAENMDVADTEALREQVDLALMDPDYSIITNFPVEWNEMGADQRLLDLSTEYDLTDRQLYAGLGVTESLLSGESSYSGDRINLEVINTRYMLLRTLLQDLVEKHFLEPMCRKMGFIEIDEDGDEVVVYPRLSFTRLGLWDNQDVFDALFQLYQKGSVGLSVILDLLNIDYDATEEELKRSLFTVNDVTFNELTRSLYTSVADKLVEGSDVLERIAKELGLKYTPPAPETEGRY